MADAGDSPEKGNGIEAGGIRSSLAGAEDAGNAHQDLKDAQGVLQGDIGAIDERIKAIETQREHDLAYLEAHHELEVAEIETERKPLLKRQGELETDKKADQRRIAHWTGRLRKAAREVNAQRGNQLLYAAFATDGDTSTEGLEQLGTVDQLVRQNGGEVFVVVQGGHVAFGRIRENNDGLVIDTDRYEPGEDVAYAQLPVWPYGANGEERKGTPSYGWISGHFDKSGWDKVLFRSDTEADKVSESVDLCRFQINDNDLHLPDPSNLRTGIEPGPEVDSEKDLSRESEDRIMTGEAATDYLHAFIDDRLHVIYDSPYAERKAAAIKELSNVFLVAARIGISIDPVRFKKFQPHELPK